MKQVRRHCFHKLLAHVPPAFAAFYQQTSRPRIVFSQVRVPILHLLVYSADLVLVLLPCYLIFTSCPALACLLDWSLVPLAFLVFSSSSFLLTSSNRMVASV
eukprot:748683-Hanusia_phi.AAC.5